MSDRRLVPDGIKDQSTIEYNKLLDRIAELDLSTLLVYIIDNVNASALPHLAEQFHVMGNEGWLLADTEAKKRSLVKTAIDRHRYKGTKYAILQVLEVLNMEGGVQEWFEYAGDPYYFKVFVNLFDRGLDDNTANLLLKLIEEQKNVRSWLDVLIIYLSNLSYIHIGCIAQIGETIEILPYSLDELEISYDVPKVAINVNLGEVITIYPEAA
ncbi:MAG: phage tail protein I [Candidatus Abawacabacteria bacterium]|nr:phage tail protein I [Candidatus Abawacabacteria bacterium]